MNIYSNLLVVQNKTNWIEHLSQFPVAWLGRNMEVETESEGREGMVSLFQNAELFDSCQRETLYVGMLWFSLGSSASFPGEADRGKLREQIMLYLFIFISQLVLWDF